MRMKLLLLLSSLAALTVIGVALWLWGFGGADWLSAEAALAQREAQNTLAQGLRALKGGQPGAFVALLSICFAYGFFHAVGPGHGKLVLGGYGLGRAVTLWRLVGLALASSLAQAGTAVALVGAGVWVFDLSRTQLSDTADWLLAPVSYAMMAGLGLYLIWRGGRRLWAELRPVAASTVHSHDHSHSHDHTHDHPHAHAQDDTEVCATCGHRHAPSLQEVAGLRSLREAAMIVLAIAARPCTGAVFLLLLTWRLDVFGAGVAGAFAMGAGTATVTVVVAVMAALLRGGLLARWGAESTGSTGGAAFSQFGMRFAATLEVLAGGVVALLCLQLMLRSL